MMAIGSVRKAVAWVNKELGQDPLADKTKLINEASQKFDLTPIESEDLASEIKKDTR
ncbi:hypothetical protein MNBD_BACTEROID05-24 [hydrothermal vent metagenome]|uniref:Uncharacterized protein n=1 Tax=hydrothermal vent metagenome TaxID=652676 RepID=A0A3B0TTN2_9ZZZZ